jgi:predicted MFS family arabinose efflux permease
MAGLTIVTTLPGFTAFLAGSILLLLLVRRSRHVESPVLDIGLFQRDMRFSAANLAIFIFNAGGFAVIFLLSLFLQYIQGYDARFAGLILIIMPAFMALAFIGGKLSDRIKPWIVAAAGAALSAAGLGILIFLGAETPLAVIVITLALIGTGVAFFQPSIVNSVMGSVPREVYALASGTAETMRLAGMTVSTAIATVVFALSIGTGGITPGNYPAFLGSLRFLFLIYFLIGILCIAVSFFVGRQRAGAAPSP